MSTKKHHTDDVAKISWHGGLYVVPIDVMERYQVKSDDQFISVDDLFSDLTQESGEPGVLLKGLRCGINSFTVCQSDFSSIFNFLPSLTLAIQIDAYWRSELDCFANARKDGT